MISSQGTCVKARNDVKCVGEEYNEPFVSQFYQTVRGLVSNYSVTIKLRARNFYHA